ncbi:nitrous oxide reductase family maturation protein NosD [Microbulbifer sp. TRSA001]|uniref:nitrous oxide reductase family maturation protein NosD n=1 Tax=Microbulbifer sp. TRSA001 TaxID=3243381 RepID=UPI00403932AF
MANAAVISLTPQDDLQLALDRSQVGDTLILGKGIYLGNFILRNTIELTSEEGAVIDAGGKGHALQIEAENSYVHHLQIINWGEDLTSQDAAILLSSSAIGSRIEKNSLHGGGFGIWVDTTRAAKILNNKIRGNPGLRAADRGNGIHLFNVSQVLVKGNEIWGTRDGIYIDSSNNNELIGNYLHDLRYGVHYMYSYHNLLQGNLTENTRTGYALMQSKYLKVLNNRSVNDVNYGILMNYITNSVLRNNDIRGIQNRNNPHMQKTSIKRAKITGLEGKALFIYNSLFNQFAGNRFADSDIGIHLTAASEDNALKGNSFVNNKTQVKYVSSRSQDWVGNYWSDYLGWDMNGDGVGDIKYEPNDSVDQILWKFPSARLLLNSPAIETLRWVQRQFPVFKGPGVIDSQPLMTETIWKEAETKLSDESDFLQERIQAGAE